MQSESQNIPEITENLIPEEVMVEVTNEALYLEVSEKTKVSVDTVKTILTELIKHQLEVLNL